PAGVAGHRGELEVAEGIGQARRLEADPQVLRAGAARLVRGGAADRPGHADRADVVCEVAAAVARAHLVVIARAIALAAPVRAEPPVVARQGTAGEQDQQHTAHAGKPTPLPDRGSLHSNLRYPGRPGFAR